jgi:hydroxyethylthiazole kinase-like sugar kinase family protein
MGDLFDAVHGRVDRCTFGFDIGFHRGPAPRAWMCFGMQVLRADDRLMSNVTASGVCIASHAAASLHVEKRSRLEPAVRETPDRGK